MIKNQEDSQTAQKHSWASFLIGELDRGEREKFANGSTTLIGHHLAVFASDSNERWTETRFWMVNLQDTTVQEWTGEDNPWRYFTWAKEKYSLNSYGENQIIKFGGDGGNRFFSDQAAELIWITIDSFNPLKIRYERIHDKNAPDLSGHTAAIYQDCLYVFGGRYIGTGKSANKQLWCFDLKQKIWKECKTTGKAPKEREEARSFIRDDNLYIYGGFARRGNNRVNYAEISTLNLKTMKWTTITQKDPKPGQDSTFFGRFSTDFYGDNMLVLKNEKEDESDELYCCNRQTLGSWSKFDVKGVKKITTIGNSVIYKNVLYTFATKYAKRHQLLLAALELDSLGLTLPKSLEEEKVSSLFMSEDGSDITFKIGEKMIFAHKKVLIEKCKFFANLFKSGMMESRQDVIDINDCEYETFQEFLRFLYCGTINVKPSQTIKLLSLADKYVQEDLHERCVTRIGLNLTSKMIYQRHDFARKKGIVVLKNWCMKFFEYGMDYNDGQFFEYVKNLECKNDPEYETDNRQLIEIAVNATLEHISAIAKEGTQEQRNYFEDFLVKNISMQNILSFAREFGHFDLKMTNLRKAVLKFVYTNFELLQEKGLDEKIQLKYWYHREFGTIFSNKREEQQKKNEETQIQDGKMLVESKADSASDERGKEKTDTDQRKAIKRMDPTSHLIEEEGETGPILKKTKQSPEN